MKRFCLFLFFLLVVASLVVLWDHAPRFRTAVNGLWSEIRTFLTPHDSAATPAVVDRPSVAGAMPPAQALPAASQNAAVPPLSESLQSFNNAVRSQQEVDTAFSQFAKTLEQRLRPTDADKTPAKKPPANPPPQKPTPGSHERTQSPPETSALEQKLMISSAKPAQPAIVAHEISAQSQTGVSLPSQSAQTYVQLASSSMATYNRPGNATVVAPSVPANIPVTPAVLVPGYATRVDSPPPVPMPTPTIQFVAVPAGATQITAFLGPPSRAYRIVAAVDETIHATPVLALPREFNGWVMPENNTIAVRWADGHLTWHHCLKPKFVSKDCPLVGDLANIHPRVAPVAK